MLKLSKPAMKYAAEICEVYPQYHIVIFVKESCDIDICYGKVTDYINWLAYCKTKHDADRCDIVYRNGSVLSIIKIPYDSFEPTWDDYIIADDLLN